MPPLNRHAAGLLAGWVSGMLFGVGCGAFYVPAILIGLGLALAAGVVVSGWQFDADSPPVVD